MQKLKNPYRTLVFIFMSVLAFSAIYPLVFMLLTTFRTREEYFASVFALPTSFNLINYQIIFDQFDILRLAYNSMFIALTSLAISLTINSMAAYGFTKFKFRFNKMLFTLVIACMMVPGQVLMIPVFDMMSDFGLVNNPASVILFYVTISIPFGTFLLSANLRGMPNEVLQAAKIDGAGHIKIYTSIVLPLLKPSLITLAILNFLTYWNELLYAMLFLQTNENRTLTVAIATLLGSKSNNVPYVMTGLFINSLPVIIIFLIFQKQIQKGMVEGAIK